MGFVLPEDYKGLILFIGRLTKKDGTLPVTREMMAGGSAGLCQVRGDRNK